jgi:hypothetical protein
VGSDDGVAVLQHQVGTYAQSGTPKASEILSWDAFAATLDVDPRDWPPLGYDHGAA